jgi:hypothetical protein
MGGIGHRCMAKLGHGWLSRGMGGLIGHGCMDKQGHGWLSRGRGG